MVQDGVEEDKANDDNSSNNITDGNKKKIDGRDYSGGLLTIVNQKYVINADADNSSNDFLICNILLQGGGYLKTINYYARPHRRKRAMNALLKVIKRIRRAEPGVQIVLAGDFNHQLHIHKDFEYQCLNKNLMNLINNNNEPTCIRTNT